LFPHEVLAFRRLVVLEKACANLGNFVLSQLLLHGHDIRTLALPKSPVPLHCMAVSAGYEQRLNEVYSWNGLERGSSPFVVLQHTLLGEGQLDFAGTRYRLASGDTMVLTTPHQHRYWLERGGRWEYFWIVLNGREALRLVRTVIDARGPVLRLSSPLIDRMAAACLTLLETVQIAPGEASSAAYAAVAAIHDGAFETEVQPVLDLPAGLRRVVGYIEANLAAPIQVQRLADVAETSRAHFVRTFTAALGVPPSKWVFERRIEHVERLLIATDMSVTAIAQTTGFSDANYLAKAFRRSRGIAPLDLRRSRREKAS
jgi:AraC family transcriptional regulator